MTSTQCPRCNNKMKITNVMGTTKEITWNCPRCGMKMITGYESEGFPVKKYITELKPMLRDDGIHHVVKSQSRLSLFGGDDE